jgi:hypothetical protein
MAVTAATVATVVTPARVSEGLSLVDRSTSRLSVLAFTNNCVASRFLVERATSRLAFVTAPIVFAPVGNAFVIAVTAPTVVTAVRVEEGFNKELTEVSRAKPVIAAGGVSVAICAAVNTTGTEAAARACPKAGVFVSILFKEVFPVVCKVAVEAPEGKGNEEALIACVAGKFVIAVLVSDTGTAVARNCVSVNPPVVVTVPAIETGCVAWKNVPVTATGFVIVSTVVTFVSVLDGLRSVFIAVVCVCCSDNVEAPVASVAGLLGDIVTTSAGSATTGAVEAPLTATIFVPAVSLNLCFCITVI